MGKQAYKKTAALLVALFLFFALASCGDNTGNASPSVTEGPNMSDLPIPGAIKLDIPQIYEVGYNPYGSVWVDDKRIMIMAQSILADNWDYCLFVHDITTGETWRTAEELDNFGWFGRRLNDGRICFYDFDKVIVFDKERCMVEEVYYFPENVYISEVDISPDGNSLIYTDLDNGSLYITDLFFEDILLLAEAEGGSEEELYFSRPAEPKFSEDGKYIYYQVYGSDQSEIHLLTPKGEPLGSLINPFSSSYYPLEDGGLVLISHSGSISKYEPDKDIVQLIPENEYRPIAWDKHLQYTAAVIIDENTQTDVLKLFDLKSGKELMAWDLGHYAPIYFDIDAFSPSGESFFFLFSNEDNDNICYLLKP